MQPDGLNGSRDYRSCETFAVLSRTALVRCAPGCSASDFNRDGVIVQRLPCPARHARAVKRVQSVAAPACALPSVAWHFNSVNSTSDKSWSVRQGQNPSAPRNDCTPGTRTAKECQPMSPSSSNDCRSFPEHRDDVVLKKSRNGATLYDPLTAGTHRLNSTVPRNLEAMRWKPAGSGHRLATRGIVRGESAESQAHVDRMIGELRSLQLLVADEAALSYLPFDSHLKIHGGGCTFVAATHPQATPANPQATPILFAAMRPRH